MVTLPVAKEKIQHLVKVLEKLFPDVKGPSEREPFKVLVRAVLSQNTNFKNEREAYLRLKQRIGTTPQALANASEEDIADCIRVAGLYRIRAKRIKRLAEIVVKKYGGSLDSILSKPTEEARKELLTLPGVGFKTADIILLFCAGKPVMPVDTHITRISKRLGIVKENAGYEEIRRVYEDFLPPGLHERVHLQLIMFGRSLCKAKNPKCNVCPLKSLCDFYVKKSKIS